MGVEPVENLLGILVGGRPASIGRSRITSAKRGLETRVTGGSERRQLDCLKEGETFIGQHLDRWSEVSYQFCFIVCCLARPTDTERTGQGGSLMLTPCPTGQDKAST